MESATQSKFEQQFYNQLSIHMCSLHEVKRRTYQSFNVEEFLYKVHQSNATGLDKTGTVPEAFGKIRKSTTRILQQ